MAPNPLLSITSHTLLNNLPRCCNFYQRNSLVTFNSCSTGPAYRKYYNTVTPRTHVTGGPSRPRDTGARHRPQHRAAPHVAVSRGSNLAGPRASRRAGSPTAGTTEGATCGAAARAPLKRGDTYLADNAAASSAAGVRPGGPGSSAAPPSGRTSRPALPPRDRRPPRDPARHAPSSPLPGRGLRQLVGQQLRDPTRPERSGRGGQVKKPRKVKEGARASGWEPNAAVGAQPHRDALWPRGAPARFGFRGEPASRPTPTSGVLWRSLEPGSAERPRHRRPRRPVPPAGLRTREAQALLSPR